MSDMQTLTHRQFSVAEYHRMGSSGIFRPDERLELLDGLIVEMGPIGPTHWQRHMLLTAYLHDTLRGRAGIAGQASFPLGRKNEPQPDVAIVAPMSADDVGRELRPDEIFAFIELADTSLSKDTGPKLRIYARAKIADYLIVDIGADVLYNYSDPRGASYVACARRNRGDSFQLTRLPGITLSADPFLKPT